MDRAGRRRRMLMFRREDRERVARGEITVTFRLWKRAKVSAGKRYRTPIGTLEIEDVRVIPAGAIARRDVRPSGCRDIAAIRELAGEHTHAVVTPDTLLYRVQFRFVGGEPEQDVPRAPDDVDVRERLARLDAKSTRGPWTLAVLRMIDAAPHVPARVLAAELDWERLDFKAHVRRLRRLGLTISHEIGYELSPAGNRYLASVESSASRQRGGAGRSPRIRGRTRS
jgi:hypothetical protein